MTRAEYFQKQKDLSHTAARAEAEAARRIRAVTRELVLPLVRQYAEQGTIIYPVEELSRAIDHIIREEASKPVMAARKLQEDMEASLAEKLGVRLGHRQAKETPQEARERRLNAAKKPVGSIIKTPGRGWGYGTSSQGLASYYRDPQTGKIVWTDLPLEYQFRKRADLSTRVWKAVEEQEQAVFDTIQGGRKLGRNVKQICVDLEEYINKPNGGEIVVGRWMGMFPNTEAGRKEAWKREYLAAHGGFQPGSEAAKALLKQKDAQDWVRQKMAETTRRGTPRLPDAVRQYAQRLGKAGLDYRAIRIARTELTAQLADEQLAIAENSDICTGEMDFVMERGRDAWPCNCEKYAEQSPWKVDDPERPEIPVHRNCMCEWRPRLKTDAEILASLKEEMKEDLAIIEGTDEQKEFLEKYSEEAMEDFGGYHYSKSPGESDSFDDGSNTDQDVRDYVKKEMENKGLYADFDESGKETIEYIPKLQDKADNDFTGINKVCKGIVFTESFDGDEGAGYSEAFQQIAYNKKVFQSEEALRAYIEKDPGWFASTELSGVIAHEYGHAIVTLIKQKTGKSEEEIFEVIDKLLMENGIHSISDRRTAISIYAGRSTRELISEAVSDVYTMQNPRTICNKIYNVLKLLYINMI